MLNKLKLKRMSSMVKSKKTADSSNDNESKSDENNEKSELVWRFAIGMDSVCKRPYSPTIELVTHPAKKLKVSKEEKVDEEKKALMAPPTLSLIFRTRYNLYYIVEGLRLPVGVDRRSLQCYWRSSDQHAVIWAPCTKETKANVITGVSICNNGYSMEQKEFNMYDVRQLVTLQPCQNLFDYAPKNHDLEVRINVPDMGSSTNALTCHSSHASLEPVAYECQILEANEAAKLQSDEEKASKKLEKKMEKEKSFDGDGDYEKQYWFRNPTISFNHYGENEEGKDGEGKDEEGKDDEEEEKDEEEKDEEED